MINEVEEYFNVLAMDKSEHTLRSYRTAWKKLSEFLNIETFEDIVNIKSDDIRKHQLNLKDQGISHASINTNIRPLRAMFNWFVENEYLDKNPFDRVKDLKTEKKVLAFLSEDEQEQIVNACRDDILDLLIFAILISTGLRREELCQLDLDDYDGQHLLIHGKGNKERVLALQDPIILLLDQYLETRIRKHGNRGALLISRQSDRFTGDGIYCRIKSILKKAGLPDDRIEQIHPHSLRHSFVANMLQAGNDIYVTSRGLGHANIETTMKYAHIHGATLDKAIKNQRSIL